MNKIRAGDFSSQMDMIFDLGNSSQCESAQAAVRCAK